MQGDVVRKSHCGGKSSLCSPPNMWVVQLACLLVPWVFAVAAAEVCRARPRAGSRVGVGLEKECDAHCVDPSVLEGRGNRRLLVADQNNLKRSMVISTYDMQLEGS